MSSNKRTFYSIRNKISKIQVFIYSVIKFALFFEQAKTSYDPKKVYGRSY